jgi:hypothetical protein
MEYQKEIRNCQNCKKDFVIEPEDFNFYEKIKVPAPTWCPECRMIRKAAFVNERILFKTKCFACSKNIISIYSPKGVYKVFCTDCYNDREDCVKLGNDFDSSKDFFNQYFDLFKKVPKVQLRQISNNGGCENSNFSFYSSNVYLSYTVLHSKDIYYSKQVQTGNNICIDCLDVVGNERAYELVQSNENYNCRFLIKSTRCIDSAYLFNCKNCTNCCLSYNQQNKSYVFRNKQLSREMYLKEIEALHLECYSNQEKLKQEFMNICKNSICRFATIVNSVNCTGDFIRNSKNTFNSFGISAVENSKYIYFDSSIVKDSYDLCWTGRNQLCYELTDGGSGNNNVQFSTVINSSHDIFYSSFCSNSNNLFSCTGLQNKQYCILNKQYEKEEYFGMVEKIKKHMDDMPYIDKKGRIYKYGEFFPIEFSPFAYNETLIYEQFPMKKEDVLNEGYSWRDVEEKRYISTMPSNTIPDSIDEIQDSILQEIITCPNDGKIETMCTSAYKIMPDELRFYRLMKIPIPRHCPNCRYFERKKLLNPWKLWHRKCMKEGCENEFDTSYAPDRPEIIYCEDCYKKEVY